MDRVSMCNRIGNEYKTSNIEGGEYSYVQAAGSKEKLVQCLGYEPEHFKLDIRFELRGSIRTYLKKTADVDAFAVLRYSRRQKLRNGVRKNSMEKKLQQSAHIAM